MKFSKWHIAPAEEADIRRLGEAGYPQLVSQVLAARGISTAEEAAAQLELWAEPQQQKRARRERLEQTMDAIRAKYGGKAIQPASAPLDAAPTSHDPFPGE